MAIPAGTRLGPYEILSAIGAGGMGEVYSAQDPRLSREVAVKVLPHEFTSDPERMRRFEQEARAAGMLNHPNILTIYDIGSEDGNVYVVSELLEGETLRERLREGSLPVRKVVEYALQIARGLGAAHDKGIVHRDLKPENIFVTKDGRVKILDFGLAKLTAPEPISGKHSALQTMDPGTQPGMLLGTMGYMSPEQVRSKPVDHRSDIFSFGAILYEMLSGGRAFRGDSSADLISAILREDPPDLSTTGIRTTPGLERIILHCLEKNPEERFQSTRDLAFDLEMISGISEASSSTLPIPEPVTKRKPKFLLPVALALTLGIGIVVGIFLSGMSVNKTGYSHRKVSFKKLTDMPGEELDPNLSPDGNSFVYVSDREGNADIYLARVGGQNPVNLTAKSSEDDYQPAFSPSGDQIAFRSDRDGGGLFLMGATGESVRRLTDFGFHPSWAPDGNRIIFSTVDSDALHGGEKGNLWILNVADGQKTLLLEGEDVNMPSFSPNGHRIAFWGLKGKTGQRDIWTTSVDGKNTIVVTDDPAVDWNPVWSPDGKYLYFLSDRTGSMNLHRAAIDERTGELFGEPESVVTPSAWISDISFGKNSNTIAYAAFDRRFEIHKVSFDPEEEKVVGNSQEITSSADYFDRARFSPDGEWLTFFTVWPQQDVYVTRTDGTERRKLTDDLHRDRYPSWSPDGKSLIFMSDRSGKYEFWMIDRDGSGLRKATDGPLTLWIPQFSHNTPQLMGINENGTYLYDTTKSIPWSHPEELPAVPGRPNTHFQGDLWSPDGSRIAGRDYGGTAELFIYDTGTKEYKIFPVPHPSYAVGWFSDNRRYLIADDFAFRVVDTESGATREVPVAGLNAVPDFANLSYDNRTLYVSLHRSESDIWMLTLDSGDQ